MEAHTTPIIQVADSSLSIIEIDPQTDHRWEALATRISAIPVLLYHPAWLYVMEKAFGYKAMHLGCENIDGELVGILPLFYQRGWRTGRQFFSVFTGPLAYDDHTRAALLHAAVKRTRAERDSQLHINTLSNTLDGLVDGLTRVPVCETYQLALPERPELLRLPSSIKRAINKATRSGVQIREGHTRHELRVWYRLYLQTSRKLLITPKPYHFFELAWDYLHSRGLLRLLLAEYDEQGQRRLIAGSLYLMWGETFTCFTEGWRQEDQALRPNDLLHWHAIQMACTHGFRWYDFADVDLGNQGLAQYKRKWGTEVKMVYGYFYPDFHEVTPDAHTSSKNPVSKLSYTVWQHLPISLLALLSRWYHALHLY